MEISTALPRRRIPVGFQPDSADVPPPHSPNSLKIGGEIVAGHLHFTKLP
jgi:hypothetical protein